MFGFSRRAAKFTWTVALIATSLYVCVRIDRALLMAVLAIFFAYMIFPPVRWLHRLVPRLGRGGCTVVVYLVLIALVAGIAALFGPRFVGQIASFAHWIAGMSGPADLVRSIPLPHWLEPYRSLARDYLAAHLGSIGAFVAPAAATIGDVAKTVGLILVYLALVPILSFLFIVKGPRMRERYLAWAARQEGAVMWRGLMHDLDRLLGRYMRALLLLSLATTVSYSIAFTLGAMPYALLLALGAGVFEFVPVVGPLIAVVASLAVAAASGYGHLSMLIGFFAIYRLCQDYVLSPCLMSGNAAIPAWLVLLGAVAGEQLGGMAGVFLSVPVIAVARLVVLRLTEQDGNPGAQAAHDLIADDAAESKRSRTTPSGSMVLRWAARWRHLFARTGAADAESLSRSAAEG